MRAAGSVVVELGVDADVFGLEELLGGEDGGVLADVLVELDAASIVFGFALLGERGCGAGCFGVMDFDVELVVGAEVLLDGLFDESESLFVVDVAHVDFGEGEADDVVVELFEVGVFAEAGGGEFVVEA